VKVTNHMSEQPLFAAALHGHTNGVQLKSGAEVDYALTAEASGLAGEYALIAAASKDHARVLHALLAGCATGDTPRASDRLTALHAAADAGYVSTAEALLGAGAEADAGDASSQTPLHLAVEEGMLALCRHCCQLARPMLP
jgi:hypothetical protein